MKVRIYPREDGSTRVIIERTRPWEQLGVHGDIPPAEDFETALGVLITKADGEGKQAWKERRQA